MSDLNIYASEEVKEKLTEDQKKAIQHDNNILVSASAGSGKTYSLVYRILAELGRGTPLKKILVLVFNEAAGEELRLRLAKELYNQILLPETEVTPYFRAAIDDLPNAHIGTTHSFCANMIRQYFDKVDISPTFAVATEDAADILANMAMDEILNEYWTNNDEVFITLSNIFASSRGEDAFKKALSNIYTVIDARPNKEEFLEKIKAYYTKDLDSSEFGVQALVLFRNKLRQIKEEMSRLKEELDLAGPAGLAKYEDIFNDFSYISNKIEYFKTYSIQEIVDVYDEEFVSKSAKKNTEKDPVRAKCAALIRLFKKTWKAFFDSYKNVDFKNEGYEQNGLFVNKLIEMVSRFDEKFNELKKQRNILTFNDLEHKMVELLNVYGDTLKLDFDVLFVDEYQDVNPTQEEIYSKIINKQAFFVGDVKQAIYEFRLSDPSIFLKRKEEYDKKAGCENISFNKNFRSTDGILNFANEIFSVVMTEENSGINYKRDAMFDTEDKEIGEDVELHLFINPRKVEEEKNYGIYKLSSHIDAPIYEKVSDMQGNFIAKTIKETVGIKKNKEGKPYEYSDIVILFRKRGTTANDIIKILKKENIPVDSGSFLKGSSSSERDIMNLLKIIDNPRQDIPLVGFMLSVMGGFDEKELMEISSDVLVSKYANYYEKVLEESKKDTPLGNKVKDMLAKIAELRTKASIKTVSELIRTIIADFSYDAYLMQEGDNEAIELNSFIDAIECIDENNDLSKFIALYCETNSDFDVASVNGGNRVRIATYHSFKGLEAPIVFLPGLDERAGIVLGKEDVVYCNNGLISLSYYDTDKKTKVKSINRSIVEELRDFTDSTSNMRLFYVALTRAKEKMYLLGNIGTPDKKTQELEFATKPSIGYKLAMLDFIEEYMYKEYMYKNNGRKLKLGTNVFFHEENNVKAPFEREQFVEPNVDDFIVEEIIKDGTYIYPYESATKLSAKYSVTGLNPYNEEDPTPEKFERKTNKGTYAHKIMELIDLNAVTEEQVDAEKKKMIAAGELTTEQADVLSTKDIVEIMKTDIMKLARESKVHRELMFTMYVPANEVIDDEISTDKILVQGVIDLLIESDQGVYIVDYKLSNRSEEDLKEKYSKQLKLYKKAYETATGKKVDHTVIVSLINGKAVPID